jgi:dienelactone hydrolase
MPSKPLLLALLLLCTLFASAQRNTPEDFGFRHLQFPFEDDMVNVLIKSRKGDEQVPKPLFFFCQGSLPVPLIIYDEQGTYGTFPFNTDSLAVSHHLVIVGKPGVPLIAHANGLAPNFAYIDSTGQFPAAYSSHNLLSYYTRRNLEVIKRLRKEPWVSKERLVVAGHSEGSTVACRMASASRWVTHLIYSGGNPMGRIMSIIAASRANETDTDSTRFGEEELKYWDTVVAHRSNMDATQGDTDQATYEFSDPSFPYLQKLRIPVLVTYGTRDWCTPFNDYLRVETARSGKTNLTFRAYVGTEHNYFAVDEDGRPDYETFNWDKVAEDWRVWLEGR